MSTRPAWIRALLPAVLALPLLAACGGGGHPTGASPSGGPPPGGWPKPVNGKLTAAMCGLLTDADYEKYGHMRLSRLSAGRADTVGPNVVACGYQGDDNLELNLQPGILAAHLIFTEDTKRHKKERGAGAAAPSVNVVPGADESWFDVAGNNVPGGQNEYELEFRRGALVATLQLGFLADKKQADPRTLLTGLATLVMKRTDAGASGPGTFRTVHYRVTGHGVANSIQYTDPNTLQVKEKKNVHLPWSKDIPYAERGAGQMDVILSAIAFPKPPIPAPAITCSVTTEHRAPVTNTGTGSADCQGSLSPPSGGG